MLKADEVEVIARDVVYAGYARVERYRLRHPRYQGDMSEPLSREVLERGQVAAVLPIDVRRRKVVLIEQFRPGAFVRGWHPWLLECVAGVIDNGECAQELCHREAMEEAGCTIRDLQPMMAPFLTSPGMSTETISLFWAKAVADSVGGIHGLCEEGENIRALSVDIDEAIDWLDRGLIVNAKTVIALQWLARNQHRLQDL